jgi:hypothetical protein
MQHNDNTLSVTHTSVEHFSHGKKRLLTSKRYTENTYALLGILCRFIVYCVVDNLDIFQASDIQLWSQRFLSLVIVILKCSHSSSQV